MKEYYHFTTKHFISNVGVGYAKEWYMMYDDSIDFTPELKNELP